MRTKQIIGLIVLSCIVASLGVLAGLIAWLGAATGLRVGLLIAAGLMGTYLVVVGPWQRRWGATTAEVSCAMPGDELLPSRRSLVSVYVSRVTPRDTLIRFHDLQRATYNPQHG